MALETAALVDALVSHALSTGLFDAVGGHEPKSAPGNGLTGAVWVDRVEMVSGASGLASASAYMVFSVRVYRSMLTDPQDSIDPVVMDGVDALMRAYAGDFTLDGLVRDVDLFGAHGAPLGGRAGYVEQDGKMFRAFVLTVPMVINDLWDQAP